MSALVQHEDASVELQRILPKQNVKTQAYSSFHAPSAIVHSSMSFSINVMPTSIYKSLNLRDLEPIGMEIQLANRKAFSRRSRIDQPVDLASKFLCAGHGGRTVRGRIHSNLERPFFITARTKIDVHAGTLSMEFGDTFAKFNIFEVLKHPIKDHSIFSIDAIDGLVEDYFQIGIGNANLDDFVDISSVINCFCTAAAKANSKILSYTLYFSYSEDFISDLIHCRIDEIPGKSQHAKFPIAGTSKPGVTGVSTLINAESDSGIKFRRIIRVESDS
ncbi:hypothetical protein CR513_50886, partial [Mucuna pruriens]